MKAITMDEAEADLRAALDSGDPVRIAACAALVDALDHHAPPPTVLSAALWYALRGLHVFPCQVGSKVPFKGTRGVKEATLDPETINTWWADHPDANVAIATGWLMDAWDFDGPRAVRSRLDHWDEFTPEPGEVWAKVSTPRPGGVHWWVHQTTGVKNGKHIYPGIDYRALGGYVLAPPSVLDDRLGQVAGTYRFLTHDGLDTLEVW